MQPHLAECALGLLLTLPYCVESGHPTPPGNDAKWGQPDHGVRISLSSSDTLIGPMLRFTMQNVGSETLVLRVYAVTDGHILLDDFQLTFRDPVIGWRRVALKPLLLISSQYYWEQLAVVRPGEQFVVEQPLSAYNLPAFTGQVELAVEFQPRKACDWCWMGDVMSNVVAVSH